jgi:5-methylcytosine-specific restriction endonuclease McrA
MSEGNKLGEEHMQNTRIEETDYLQDLDGDASPGLELREFLQHLCPFDLGTEISFVSQIDFAFKAEGSLSKLLYESTINYLVRRLINTAQFLRRKYESDDFPEGRFVEELRQYLKNEVRFRTSDVERLLVILQSCLAFKNQNRKSKKKQFIKRNFPGSVDLLCYICGKSLTLEEIQIEHKWPKTLGGSSKDLNLKISCCSCNAEKQSYIDGSDFHYEHICLSTDESDEESFSREFKRIYKIALSAKHDHKCTLCGKSAESVGRLNFVRKNLSDSWHFLNIDTVCENCRNFGI